MTEKQFKLEDVGFVRDGDKLLNPYDIVDKLNGQYDEIEQLKKEIFELKYDMDRLSINNKGLRIENEQLKQVSQDYEDDINNWFIENWHTLSDEQKQSAHLELGIDICDDFEFKGDVK